MKISKNFRCFSCFRTVFRGFLALGALLRARPRRELDRGATGTSGEIKGGSVERGGVPRCNNPAKHGKNFDISEISRNFGCTPRRGAARRGTARHGGHGDFWGFLGFLGLLRILGGFYGPRLITGFCLVWAMSSGGENF